MDIGAVLGVLERKAGVRLGRGTWLSSGGGRGFWWRIMQSGPDGTEEVLGLAAGVVVAVGEGEGGGVEVGERWIQRW